MERCEICKRSVWETCLFRANPKGVVPAIWRCREHTTTEIDPVVEDITRIIEESNGSTRPWT
jgi:hypothetical protein